MTVRIEGLKELRRDLRAIDKNLPKELNAALKEGAEIARQESSKRGAKYGLEGTQKAGAQARGGFLAFPVGRRRSTFFRAHPFIRPAVDDKADEIEEKVDDGIGSLTRRHGFR